MTSNKILLPLRVARSVSRTLALAANWWSIQILAPLPSLRRNTLLSSTTSVVTQPFLAPAGISSSACA